MAQLPPKVPNIPPNWPSLGHHKALSMGPFAGSGAAGNQPSWVDEFLGFSSARRGSHRRSVSDSVAFLEAPMGGEFDRLDDDQLMYMFSEDLPPNAASAPVSSSNPSSPSDHNSINEEKTVAEQQLVNESEVQSECQTTAVAAAPAQPYESESIVDPKRVKR